MCALMEQHNKLLQHCHSSITEHEKRRVIECYEILKTMVDSSDAKTFDILSMTAPIFCFTRSGQRQMIPIFVRFCEIGHLPMLSVERQTLSKCVLNVARDIDRITHDE